MAPKGKKGKKSSPKKQASEKISEPEFLKQLGHWRIRDTTWGGYGVSKSWKSVSKQCNSNSNYTPQLQLSGKYQPDHHFLMKIQFLPAGFYSSESKLSIWTSSGPCRVWWVYPDLFAAKNFSNSSHIYIPPGGVMVVFTGLSRPSLLFLRPPHHKQVEHLDGIGTIVDPYDSEKQSIIFTNGIAFKGKLYALSLHGALAVVEKVDSSFTITGFGKNRAVPSVPSRCFVEYLIESNGEILLLFLISRKSISMIDYVEVVKLDLVTLSWVKMDNLGDRALFLSGTHDRCKSVSANQVAYKSNQVAYKSNHIYFTHQGMNCWKEFDMESRSISPCL